MFAPRLWIGAALGGLSVVLFVVSGVLAKRGVGVKPEERQAREGDRLRAQGAPPGRCRHRVRRVVDDGVDAEIEAILRKRGIT